jgi:hypothetical protein
LHIHSKRLSDFSSYILGFQTGDRICERADWILMTRDTFHFHKHIDDLNHKKIIIDDSSLEQIVETITKDTRTELKIAINTHALSRVTPILLKLDSKQIHIYSGNSDHSFDSKILLEANHVKSIHAQNPSVLSNKLSLLPIGIANRMWPHGNLSELYKAKISAPLDRINRVYVRLNENTFTYRRDVINQARAHSLFDVYETLVDHSTYLEELSKYKYALCVRGNGLDTHRFWECVYLGVIPIIVNNEYTNSEIFTQNLYNYMNKRGLHMIVVRSLDELLE